MNIDLLKKDIKEQELKVRAAENVLKDVQINLQQKKVKLQQLQQMLEELK